MQQNHYSTAVITKQKRRTSLLIPCLVFFFIAILHTQSQAQCNITYQYRGDIEEFYIPDGATKLIITLAGAQGGKRHDPETNTAGQGGKGAKLVAEFEVGGANELQTGDYISVIVGGRYAGSSGSGGGGSFIAKGQGFGAFGTNLLMAAGGGGGGGAGSDHSQFGGNGQDGGPGKTFPSGSGNGGNNGGVNGGGAGGGGIFTNGNNNGSTEGGEAIIDGAGSYYGHFGSGGGGGIDGGGGGGYTGGNGGNNLGYLWGKGGTGGTSYYDEVNGTLIESLAGENEGNGYITIQVVGADCDFDNDGWATFMGDCEDDDNTIYPYAPTVCNGLDNNCDGLAERTGTIYVNQNANGSNDGSSWINAFTNLQTALTVADCNNEIWVAQGTYSPTVDSTGNDMPDDPALKAFLIDKEMKLYGGFGGFESSLSQRNIEANPTIISGDLGDEVYSEAMLYFRNVSNFTTLDGFTLTNGTTDILNGRAIYIEANGAGNETSPTIQNCMISQTYSNSNDGTGIVVRCLNGAQSHPIFSNVIFSENRGYAVNFDIEDGSTSNPVFTQCSFEDGLGAPMELEVEGIAHPVFNECTFTGNSADSYLYGYAGDLRPEFNGCAFTNNSNSSSGGVFYIYAYNGAAIESDFTNCIFMGNKGSTYGGAIYARNGTYNGSTNELNFTNCSFSGNSANNGGALFIDDYVTANITNCILWGNSSEIGADGTVNVSYSIVEGGYPGTGNLDQKPIFLQHPNHEDAPNVVGDLHIHSCSPALDAGTSTGAPNTDLDGNARPYNGVFDMGAFELQSIDMTVGTYYADEDGDGYGDPNSAVVDCGLPPGYVADNTDCDDTDELEFPGQVWYYDGDFDGYGTGTSEEACERPSFYHFAAAEMVSTTGDCNDSDYYINPSQPDICDGIDNNCDDIVEPNTIIYVKADANGTNNGTSWQNAYTNLQDAIDEAECVVNQIWVAAGTYKPTRPYNDGEERDKTFFMDKNLILYGGFNGTETEASQREPKANVTILSGDLGIPGDISDNAYSVVMTQGMDRTFLMDGFTISDGNADDAASSTDPWRSHGGAWYNGKPSSAGDYLYSEPIIQNCVFTNNQARLGGAVGNRGIDGSAAAAFVNCKFDNNYAIERGGAFYNTSVGTYASAHPRIINCLFTNNTTGPGGRGGALANTGTYGYPNVLNCTFASNSSETGGAIDNSGGTYGGMRVTNCIFYSNDASGTCIYTNTPTYGGLYMYNTLVQEEAVCPTGVHCEEANIFEQDPQFVNPVAGDFHLQETSPAINVGDNDEFEDLFFYEIDVDTDLDGNARIGEDIIDLGCYEIPGVECLVELTETHIDESCPGENNGSIDLTLNNATPPLTIDWDHDGTGDNDDTEDLMDLTAGTYSVTVTDANECTTSLSITIETGMILGTWYVDADGDSFGDANDPGEMLCADPGMGYVTNNTDCDDTDEDEYPGQLWYLDGDGDGYSDGTSTTTCERPADYFLEGELTATSGDCDDNDSAINPGAPEVCDGIDNNCNNQTDEGQLNTYYADTDMDGFGDPNSSIEACSQPEGYVLDNTDCDDTDEDEYPGQMWYLDGDGDGYSDGTSTTTCERPADYFLEGELTATSGDCEDNDSAINPGAPEVCDGIDNNCNNQTDEGQLNTYYADTDMDGFGDPNSSIEACSQPEGYVSDNTDCDDTDEDEFPGQTWYLDGDGDGYSNGTTTTSCERPMDHYLASELIQLDGDCDDNNSAVHPGATEICDGIDNNCNQMIDTEDEALVDDTDPEITCPEDQDLPTDMGLCEATFTLIQPAVSDNCSDPANVVVDYRYCLQVDGLPTSCTEWTSGSINTVTLMPGEYQFEWRATDESGNEATCVQRITVVDSEPPTAQCFDYTVNFNGEETIELDPADLVDAYDNCNEVSILLDIMTIDCEDAGKVIPVTATVSDDEGPAATCQTSVTVEGLPCGFIHNPDGIGCDDGSSVNYDGGNDTWTLTSTDCSSNTFNQDEQAFIQYELCGDGEITVKVTSVSGAGWAGLVMRESIDPGSKKVELTTNLSNMAYRSVRYTTNGQAFPAQFNSFSKHWVRLVRQGNQFIGYLSFDGILWQTALFANVSMNNCILMGMMVNGFQSQGTVTATFENVTILENSNSNLSLPNNDGQLDESTDFPMSVFPNPTTGKVSLQLGETPRENLRLDILNTLGQPVIPTCIGLTSYSSEQFDLSELPAGVYYLRVYSEKGTEKLERIVLQSMP